MKLFKLTYGLMAATMFSLASCDINDYPEFDDANAFVAVQTQSASIAENAGKTLEIPVMLTSLAGQQGSVDFVITPDSVAGAIENTHFTIGNESKTLTFTKEAPVQNIVINVKDNDVFEGDKKFTIELVNAQGVKLGASKKCVVSVEDDEHPLAFILGDFTGKGTENWDGEVEWSTTVSKDATDLNKVWLTGLLPSTTTAVYGIVNEDHTEISIPTGQTIEPHSSYDIVLDGYLLKDGAETRLQSGENIIGKIAEDGTISFPDYYMGAYAYNKTTGVGAGWWTLVLDGAVLKK